MLMVGVDYLHSYCWGCYAGGGSRVVPVDSRILVLLVQGLPKGGTLDHQSFGRHHINIIPRLPVRSRIVTSSIEFMADI